MRDRLNSLKKAFFRVSIFVFILVFLSLWFFVASSFIRFMEAPAHELSHVISIKMVNYFSDNNAIVVEFVPFNADITSFGNFCNSLLEMTKGQRPIGYVAWLDPGRKFTKFEKSLVGFAGGFGGTIYILFLWFTVWITIKAYFVVGELDLIFVTIFVHIPFLATAFEAIFYAVEEAMRVGS